MYRKGGGVALKKKKKEMVVNDGKVDLRKAGRHPEQLFFIILFLTLMDLFSVDEKIRNKMDFFPHKKPFFCIALINPTSIVFLLFSHIFFFFSSFLSDHVEN